MLQGRLETLDLFLSYRIEKFCYSIALFTCAIFFNTQRKDIVILPGHAISAI